MIKKLILIAFLLLSVPMFAHSSEALAPTNEQLIEEVIVSTSTSKKSTQAEEKIVKQYSEPTLGKAVYDISEIEPTIKKYALEYGVSEYQMKVTLMCESANGNYLNNKQSDIHRNGVRENSWGIAQINLRWHPEVTKAQALDPVFSVRFMAKRFAIGKQDEWTCYRDNF